MSPKVVELVANVEAVFAVLAEQSAVAKVVAKQAYVIVRPVGSIAVFSASVVTNLCADHFSEAFEKLLKIGLKEVPVEWEILFIVCEREEGIVFMHLGFMETADSPLH